MSIKSNNPLSRMRRYPAEGWVAGVCAGLAAHFDWNVKLIRVLFFVSLLFSGFFPVGLIYCVLWYLMDEEDGRATKPAPSVSRPNGPAPTMADVKSRFSRLEERLRGIEESVTSHDYELRRELRKLES